MDNGLSRIESLEITACRGFEEGRCRFAMPLKKGVHPDVASMIEGLRTSLLAKDWDLFLRERMQGTLRHHHSFKVALSACPNGCSRPHVADIGLVRAVMPRATSKACNACGLCINLCPDGALRGATVEENQRFGMRRGAPILDASKCMACGLCVRRCPERALGRLDCSAACDEAPQADGWRILLGGCLGRHPRLASPLEGIHDSAKANSVVLGALTWYTKEYVSENRGAAKGVRFARLVEADAQCGAFLLYEGFGAIERDMLHAK